MNPPRHPLPIPLALHGDVLDPWCWLAERRIALAADELPGKFDAVERSPFPRSWRPRAASVHERGVRARELARAALEPDAPAFSPELWEAGGPSSSAPPLLAVAAAELQGVAAGGRLWTALREAALLRGLDVSRRDILLEVAARAGLDMNRFVLAFESSATERAVLRRVEEARELGVRTAPSLVLGGRWLVSRARSLRTYRTLLKRYLATCADGAVERTLH